MHRLSLALAILCAHHAAATAAETIQLEQTLVSESGSSRFGAAVALDGNLAIIGAPLHNIVEIHRFDGAVWNLDATLRPPLGGFYGNDVDINGDLAIVGDWDIGAAHIYRYNGSAWLPEALLASPVGLPDINGFGGAVAIEGNRAVVGSFLEDQTGVAYVYKLDQGQWSVEDRLVPTNGALGDDFGADVAISGGTILVGSPHHGASASYSGAAYFYQSTVQGWQEDFVAHQASDGFGGSVALDGQTAVIGAGGDSHAGWASGASYVYGAAGVAWVEQARLTASDATRLDKFGSYVDIAGNHVIVGTGPGDGQDLDPNHAAYLFTNASGSWSQTAKLPFPGNGVPATIDGNRFMLGRYVGQGPGSVRSYVLIPEPSSLLMCALAVLSAHGRRYTHCQNDSR